MASDTSPIGSFSEIQELSGKLSPQQEEDKLMRTVLQADQRIMGTLSGTASIGG